MLGDSQFLPQLLRAPLLLVLLELARGLLPELVCVSAAALSGCGELSVEDLGNHVFVVAQRGRTLPQREALRGVAQMQRLDLEDALGVGGMRRIRADEGAEGLHE